MSPLPIRRSRRGRSEGSIYQRKDGLWVGCISLGTHAGRRTRRTVYGHTKGEAAEKLRQLQSRADAGQLPDADSMTLETWLRRWLALIAKSVEPGTLKPYTRHVELHIAPRIGGHKIQRLKPVDIESFFARLTHDGVSAAMVRKIATTLTVALNHAVRSRLIPSNPTRGVRRPKATKPNIAHYTPEQAAKLVEACRGERMGPLFVLLLDSAARPGEALALAWPDIDFDRSSISITKSLEDSGRVKATKTKKSVRRIDLTPATMAALHGHRKAMLAEGRDVRRGPVWVTTRGARVLPGDLSREHLAPILERAGLPSITAYGLRHTCATMLLAANVNPKIVSERLGHSSITLTMDTYSHCMPGMQRSATDALAAALGG